MSPKKKTSSRKSKSQKKRQDSKGKRQVLIAGAFFVLAALIVVAVLFQDRSPVSQQQLPVQSGSSHDYLEDIRIEVESLLLRSGFSLSAIRDDLAGNTLVYTVRGAYPATNLIDSFEDRLGKISDGLVFSPQPDGQSFTVSWRKKTLCRVSFESESRTDSAGGTRLSIVMDDLGRDVSTARRLLEIDMPVTFSVLPGTAHAAKVASLAHRGNREVLIHLPMEPQGFPAVNPGDDALLIRQSKKEMRRRLSVYLENVPYAVGGNNHMGSRFTENLEAMTNVLEFLQEQQLFFVDSRTSGQSVGFRLANEMGLPSAGRDVFLDNVQEVGAIRAQFQKLLALAKRNGQAMGICHPYPETLEALRLEAKDLQALEVTVVPVSNLLSQR